MVYNLVMKCPNCGQTMYTISTDKSYNPDTPEHKQYYRTKYQCKEDDVWVTVEIPVDLNK